MRILCLGNNTEDSDHRSRQLAQERGLGYHGLLSELEIPLQPSQHAQPGLYHSTVFDLAFGRLVDLCNQFDEIVVLDQPRDQWSHPDAYLTMLRVVKEIHRPVTYLNPTAKDPVDFFERLVHENQSFCIFPFIELLAHGSHSTVCCRSNQPVAEIQSIGPWDSDPRYAAIRQRMIDGERIWDHCASCYQLEDRGIKSARQQETVEWANRLALKNLDDLHAITHPAYFEIRSSNRCNLQCRMCSPDASHLIDQEYRRIGLTTGPPIRTYDHGFDIVDFTNLKKLYVAGGEPLIMPEFYQFLDQCIENRQTDFELLVNTNGTKLSDKFKKQLTHFTNFQFIFSIDAFGDLNHYIRWPSDWQTIIDNLAYLWDAGHKCSVNTTVSIYNVARLHHLFQFLDQQFPNILIHVNLAESPSMLAPWSYPDSSAVIQSITRIQNMACYQNDTLLASSMDGLLRHFQSSRPDRQSLERFFTFNDLLDQSRSMHLLDHLPELASYRG